MFSIKFRAIRHITNREVIYPDHLVPGYTEIYERSGITERQMFPLFGHD